MKLLYHRQRKQDLMTDTCETNVLNSCTDK